MLLSSRSKGSAELTIMAVTGHGGYLSLSLVELNEIEMEWYGSAVQ
jgi:hypothetical protein